MDNKIHVGLFGFGCVGQGLFDILKSEGQSSIIVKKVCVKDKNKLRRHLAGLITLDHSDIIGNSDIDIILELIDDDKVSLEIAKAAFQKDCKLVSANKKMIAENFFLLYNFQKVCNFIFLYEAAVAGCIPIIRILEDFYQEQKILSIRGILNGSSNYILSKMEEQKISYENALLDAQQKGFAETDPHLDVSGTDTKYKTCILAAHAFGVIFNPVEIFNTGVQNITVEDMKFAESMGSRIKLTSVLKEGVYGIQAYVTPSFINKADSLYNINNEYNAVEVNAEFSEIQFFSGKGAGGYPTGSAVLSDISSLTRGYRYHYKKIQMRQGKESIKQKPDNDVELKVYIRYNDEKYLNEIKKIKVKEKFEKCLIAEINLKGLQNLSKEACDNLFLCYFQ